MKIKLLRTRLIILAVVLTAIVAFHYFLNFNTPFLNWYTTQAFPWLQLRRSQLFNQFSISFGDYIYLLVGLFLLLLFIRFIYFLVRYKNNKEDFWKELLRLITFPSLIYLLFMLFWGANYSRPSIAHYWHLDQSDWNNEKLIALNLDLVTKINHIRRDTIPFSNYKVINHQANSYYHEKLGLQELELKVKHTSLGYLLNYLGINGYYNPLSGEAQFNRFIPEFMHPFVVAHEMAHQIGIAAEDEANLLAYIICAESQDPSFRYSGYFNLLLYAINDLRRVDEQLAEEVLQSLNPHTKEDLKELRAMREKFKSRFRGISLFLYDEYLRWHGQSEGIKSYAGVVQWAYYWSKNELRLNTSPSILLHRD